MATASRPAALEWSGYKGARWVQPCVAWPAGKPDDAEPLDITGRTLRCTIKKRKTDDDALRSLAATITSATDGEYEIDLDTAAGDQGAALSVGHYHVDIWFTDAPADVVAIGLLQILQPIRDGDDT